MALPIRRTIKILPGHRRPSKLSVRVPRGATGAFRAGDRFRTARSAHLGGASSAVPSRRASLMGQSA